MVRSKEHSDQQVYLEFDNEFIILPEYCMVVSCTEKESLVVKGIAANKPSDSELDILIYTGPAKTDEHGERFYNEIVCKMNGANGWLQISPTDFINLKYLVVYKLNRFGELLVGFSYNGSLKYATLGSLSVNYPKPRTFRNKNDVVIAKESYDRGDNDVIKDLNKKYNDFL